MVWKISRLGGFNGPFNIAVRITGHRYAGEYGLKSKTVYTKLESLSKKRVWLIWFVIMLLIVKLIWNLFRK